MTDLDAQTLINLMQLIAQSAARIADALEMLAPPAKPQHKEIPLESWRGFDWSTIGAKVELSDNYGAAIVSWRGQQYQRRSPNNKFGEVIFFSRCTGKNEAGENQYERLCTFKPLSRKTVEPVPEKVRSLAR